MSETTRLGEGRYLRLMRRGRWEFVERTNVNGITAIVAVTDEQRLVCVEQHRVAVDRCVMDLPAGLSGDEGDEPLEQAARRELLEETGYEAVGMDVIGEAPPSPGLTSEVVTFFRARGLRRVGPGGGAGEERITVHHAPLESVRSWLDEVRARGVLIDMKLYSGLYLLGRWNDPERAPSS